MLHGCAAAGASGGGCSTKPVLCKTRKQQREHTQGAADVRVRVMMHETATVPLMALRTAACYGTLTTAGLPPQE